MPIKRVVRAVFISSTEIARGESPESLALEDMFKHGVVEGEAHLKVIKNAEGPDSDVAIWAFYHPNMPLAEQNVVERCIWRSSDVDHFVVCVTVLDIEYLVHLSKLPAYKMVYIYDHECLVRGFFDTLDRIGHGTAARINAKTYGGCDAALWRTIVHFIETGKIFRNGDG